MTSEFWICRSHCSAFSRLRMLFFSQYWMPCVMWVREILDDTYLF